MKKLLLLFILVLILVGCRSKKEFTKTEKTVKTDTVFVEKRIVDTLKITKYKEITKPVYFETVVDCNEDQSGKVGSGGNYTSYLIKDGKMYLKTNLDSVSNYWESYYKSKQIKDSTAIRKHFERQLDQVETEKVFMYPWWLYAVIAGAILLLIINIYQRFKPI